MSGLDFNGVGPFAPDLDKVRRHKLAVRLTKACEAAHEAKPAAIALGRVGDQEGREKALALLNAMPALPRRYVLARYATLSMKARD